MIHFNSWHCVMITNKKWRFIFSVAFWMKNRALIILSQILFLNWQIYDFSLILMIFYAFLKVEWTRKKLFKFLIVFYICRVYSHSSKHPEQQQKNLWLQPLIEESWNSKRCGEYFSSDIVSVNKKMNSVSCWYFPPVPITPKSRMLFSVYWVTCSFLSWLYHLISVMMPLFFP